MEETSFYLVVCIGAQSNAENNDNLVELIKRLDKAQNNIVEQILAGQITSKRERSCYLERIYKRKEFVCKLTRCKESENEKEIARDIKRNPKRFYQLASSRTKVKSGVHDLDIKRQRWCCYWFNKK